MGTTEDAARGRALKGIAATVATVAAVAAVQGPVVAYAEDAAEAADGQPAAAQGADQGKAASAEGDAQKATAQAAGDAAATSASAASEAPAQKGASAATQRESASKDGAARAADNAAQAGDEASASDAASLESGTDGRYEDHGLYLVTVRYVDDAGAQIAPSFQTELRAGASWSAPSPAIGGYDLADASQATLAGTAQGSDHSPVYTVVYHANLATYTVAVELQVGDGYRVARTETRTAPAGTRVAAAPEDIAGYHCVTGEADRATTVTADGKAVIELRYDQDVPSYGVYFETGGSYVAPQTGHAGDAVVAPAAPTKKGYAFAGWDTDGDGAADALPTAIPDHDVTARAVWAPAQATYQVRYYLQRSGDEYGGEKHYRLIETRTLTGATESTTPAAERLDTSKGAPYQYYQYARETQATIAGDGSTIVGVFYDLKPVTVSYYASIDGVHVYDADLIEKKTLLMYQDFYLPDTDAALSFYKAHGGKASGFEGYLNNESGYLLSAGRVMVTPIDVAFTGSGSLESTVIALFADGLVMTYSRNVNEGLTPGDYSDDPAFAEDSTKGDYHRFVGEGETTPWKPVQWRCSKSHWDGKDESAIDWGPWQTFDESSLDATGHYTVPGGGKNFDRVNQNVVEFRFARRSYTVTYYSNGEKVGSVTRRFGEQFATGEGVDASVLTPHDGLVFAGWAVRPTATATVKDTLTMPSQNASLYALWKRPDVTVTFDAEGGTPTAAQTVAWGAKASAPAAPTREGYAFGGWYYFGEGSPVPARFSFDQALESNMTLYAAWKSTAEPVSYTVVHVTGDGRVLARETHQGLVGETVTATPLAASDPVRAGYRYVSSTGSTLDLSRNAEGNVITFVYAKDPAYAYVVRGIDAETGRDIADMRCILSSDALIDVDAPQVSGWRVRGAGTGYVGALGSREVVFVYDRVAQPAAPEGESAAPRGAHAAAEPATASAAAGDAEARAKHAAPASEASALPATGDEAPAAPLAAAALAGAAVALGARRRGKHARR